MPHLSLVFIVCIFGEQSSTIELSGQPLPQKAEIIFRLRSKKLKFTSLKMTPALVESSHKTYFT
jgi:hypothetical protein